MRFKLKILYYWFKIIVMPKIRSVQDLAAFQKKQLKQFANKTLQKSVFYSRYFKHKIFDWVSVPQITKKVFMESFNEINTKGIKLEEAMEVALQAEKSRNFKSEINGITVGLSTGTDGKRGLFLVSEDERALWVALVMTRVIKPKIFQKQKVAFFLRANSNLYTSVSSGLFDFKYFDIFKPLTELLTELNIYQPHILASQPSLLMDIALAQKNKQINIAPIQIISFAEVLNENDKTTIRKTFSATFNVAITEVYQCTEGFLGVSCPYGTMHLNEDFVHFDKEWIDEDKFYPIITDFSRSSQPVVKYKLNDILQIKAEQCACGSKLLAIEKIIGREDDVLLLQNIKIYPDLIARKIALHTDDFQKYTLEQTNQNTLNIGIDCRTDDFEMLQKLFKTVLNELFASFGVENINYNFKNKTSIIVGNKNRKIKRINYEI